MVDLVPSAAGLTGNDPAAEQAADALSLEELLALAAERLGEEINARTVRLYATEGLIDRPGRDGRRATYGRRQLLQLLLIRSLARRGLSLAAIAPLIGLDDQAMEQQLGQLEGDGSPASSLLAAMAADGAFFPLAGGWHASRGTPVGGVACLGFTASLLACSGSFLQLLDYTSTGLTAVSALVVAAIFPLRRRMSSAAGFRMPLYPLPPLLVLGLSIWTVAAVLMQPEKRLPALLSLGTIAAGIPLAGWLVRNKK